MSTQFDVGVPQGVHVGDLELDGDLTVPEQPRGVVVFVSASGTSRFCSRNRWLARLWNQVHLATLNFDLLTLEEHRARLTPGAAELDAVLLAERMGQVLPWLQGHVELKGLPIHLFGTGSGAAVALAAAAHWPQHIASAVCRAALVAPDIAWLGQVTTPTLLIVGQQDKATLASNRDVLAQLASPTCHLQIIRGAGQRFEEPGALKQVADAAIEWFR